VTTTLTFRLDKSQRQKLRAQAKALGKTESEILRQMLDRELDARPLSERIGHLKGALGKQIRKPDAWLRELRARNWRE
jgi:hypothetical protein